MELSLLPCAGAQAGMVVPMGSYIVSNITVGFALGT